MVSAAHVTYVRDRDDVRVLRTVPGSGAPRVRLRGSRVLPDVLEVLVVIGASYGLTYGALAAWVALR